jgi:hypothetical protein
MIPKYLVPNATDSEVFLLHFYLKKTQYMNRPELIMNTVAEHYSFLNILPTMYCDIWVEIDHSSSE